MGTTGGASTGTGLRLNFVVKAVPQTGSALPSWMFFASRTELAPIGVDGPGFATMSIFCCALGALRKGSGSWCVMRSTMVSAHDGQNGPLSAK